MRDHQPSDVARKAPKATKTKLKDNHIGPMPKHKTQMKQKTARRTIIGLAVEPNLHNLTGTTKST